MKQDPKTNDQPGVQKAESKKARGKLPVEFPFPRNSLKEALAVPSAIEHDNAGQPYDPALLAKQSLNTSQRSSAFEVLLTSSEMYGLTIGNSRAEAISLTSTGDAIVASGYESIRAANIRRALLTPKIFEHFYTKYDGKNLPKEEILKIVLEQEFQVPNSDVAACYEVLMKNIADYDLLITSGENRTLYFGKLMKQAVIPQPPSVPPPLAQPPLVQPPSVQPPMGGLKKVEEKWGGLNDLLSATNQPTTSETAKVPRVFISYCKSKNILHQIRQMLDYGKVEMAMAEERETAGVPLSDKAFDMMWDCNCAIINISADTEKKQEKKPDKKQGKKIEKNQEGNIEGKPEGKQEKKQEKKREKKEEEILRINENVLAEVWGAYLHYKKRVILVIDKRLKDDLPSIMQGLTTIFYERNQLSWTDGMKLQNALNEFRNQL